MKASHPLNTNLWLSFNSTYKVRFNDCDPMGHLNNARYVDYFMNALEDNFKLRLGIDLAEQIEKGVGWVVRDHNITYLRPIKHHQEAIIQVEIVKVNLKDFLVEMRMIEKESRQLNSIMRSKFVCVDIQKQCRRAHPEDIFFLFASARNIDLCENTSLLKRASQFRIGKAQGV